MCDCTSKCLDMKTPRNVHLTAFYKRSFAYHTVKNRMPVILTKIVDSLAREKETIRKEYDEEGEQELKFVIGELSKLKYEIQTNKPIYAIKSDATDADIYNEYINKSADAEGSMTYFSSIWLLAECYMYRRIRAMFEETTQLYKYDPFRKQKQESYLTALGTITKLGKYLQELLQKNEKGNEEDFINLLKLNLWGNRCDLSLSGGAVSTEHDHLFNLEALEPNILCDDSQKIWETVCPINCESDIIDIVFDNSGYELFTDLCLADYLISTKFATQVRLYVKAIPWFISDVMMYDFQWMLEEMSKSKHEVLKTLAERWKGHLKSKQWLVFDHDFWTLPIDFSYMRTVDRALYRQLSDATLVIFKGDLNYRKLFGEKNWDPTTPVEEALQGFHPTKVCSLRTIKADIVCGLAPGVAEKCEEANEKWMETGEYGLIQFCDKIDSED